MDGGRKGSCAGGSWDKQAGACSLVRARDELRHGLAKEAVLMRKRDEGNGVGKVRKGRLVLVRKVSAKGPCG